jgi:hypothetical protein
MGILGDLFTLATAPVGSAAYVIVKKNGGILKPVVAREDGTYSFSWTASSLSWDKSDHILYWDSESDAKRFALARGLDLSEIEISWRQVVSWR